MLSMCCSTLTVMVVLTPGEWNVKETAAKKLGAGDEPRQSKGDEL